VRAGGGGLSEQILKGSVRGDLFVGDRRATIRRLSAGNVGALVLF
jgi:hypothetical protein